MDPWLEQGLLFLLAFISNTLSSLAGGGSGLLQLPVLLFLGLAFPIALATHKIASVALGIGATLRHLRTEALNWRFALFILAFGLPGVAIGTQIILQVPEHLARLALGILTLGLGFYSWRRPQLGQVVIHHQHDLKSYAIGGLVITFIGVINGSLTSGSGLFVTLWLVRWFGLDYTRAVVYTLILVGLFWNGSGAFLLALQAPVRWDWLPALFIGSLVGGYYGAHLAHRHGNLLVKRAFESLTMLVGLKLIWDAL